jgi:hypothetical protein
MLSKIKSGTLWLLGLIGTVAAVLFGFKLRRLNELEAQEKARSLEDEVKGLRDEISEHRNKVNLKEKALREKIAEWKFEQKRSQSENPDEGGPNDAA